MLKEKEIVDSTNLFKYWFIYHMAKTRALAAAGQQKVQLQQQQQQQTKQEDQQQQQLGQLPTEEVSQEEPQKKPQEESQAQPQQKDEEQREQLNKLFSIFRNNLVPAAMGLTAVCVLKATFN
ncbi:transcription factor asR4-like [Drosophila obscura]|uniref:transcription factor asR4-like n=1 Tax=Drosophila obscura TaxID=7282 RepID=UPI001BB232D4|nr:transcription factor asR4-like [Drosophila obscura]